MLTQQKESYLRTIKSLDTASSLIFLYTIDNNEKDLYELMQSLKRTNGMLDTLNGAVDIYKNHGMPEELRMISLDIINYSQLVTTIGDLLLNYKSNRIVKRLKEMKAMNRKGKPETTKDVSKKIDIILSGLIGIYERN